MERRGPGAAGAAADDARPLNSEKLILVRRTLLPEQGARAVADRACISSLDNVLHAMLRL